MQRETTDQLSYHVR